MRGVYTVGVLEALVEAGVEFPHIVACSAGACAAVSLVAGQPERNRHIYLDLLDGTKLVRFRRLLTGGNVMDIDYLAEDVTLRLCPLDIDAVRRSRTHLHVGVTDWLTGKARYFEAGECDSDDELVRLLKATCALPFFYRDEVMFRNRRYLDGGVSDPVPLEEALAVGGDDILVVLTSPIEARGAQPMSPLVAKLLSSGEAVRRALATRYLRYRRASELVHAPPSGTRIRVIRPSRELPVRRTTTDRDRLEAGCDLGLEDGRRFFASFDDA